LYFVGFAFSANYDPEKAGDLSTLMDVGGIAGTEYSLLNTPEGGIA